MSDIKLSEEDMRKINKKLLESLQNYKKMVNYMSGDVPIGSLCLKKQTEKVLNENGICRVYELFDLDFTKIEGLNDILIRDLTSRLNQFLSMC